MRISDWSSDVCSSDLVGVNSQINSQQGGSVIVQVSRDAFGYHNRNVLVPKGSRLICDYSSPRKQGETRLAFNCTRILMAGYRAEILQLTDRKSTRLNSSH